MADRSTIEWTDATWNPIAGCTRVSEGCRNCYAEVMAARFSDPGQWGHSLAKRVKLPDGTTDHRWTGQMRFNEKALALPLTWKKPRRIFVNSTSDLFHEGVQDDWLDRIFAVMGECPQHTFQILTKRPERAREYLTARRAGPPLHLPIGLGLLGYHPFNRELWPPRNVWLGTSVEDQATADARIPHLLATPAAVRFSSAEPLLGPVILLDKTNPDWLLLDWVIVGGESGPGARPMHPDWARSLRDQCQAAGVPFFFKQWGEWGPGSVMMTTGERVFRAFKDYQHWVNKAPTWVNGGRCLDAKGRECRIGADFMRARDESAFPVTITHRLGKKAAGRLLDGREWNEVPHG